MAESDPSQTLHDLSDSLTRLESSLKPLLATRLDQLVEDNDLDPLAQARLQVLASYVVHDLVWVYLKTAGVDPTAHPVMQEIERLKGYFGKLKAAQSGTTPASDAKPSRARMQLDKAAANRFISAAINSNRARVDPNYSPADPMAIDDEDAEAGPSGTHIRFSEAEQEDVDRLLEDKDLSDDEEAEDSDGVVEEMLRGAAQGRAQPEGEAEKKRKAAPVASADSKKGKRKAMDPFSGYDQPKPATSATSEPAATPAPSASSAKSAKRSPNKSATTEVSALETPALSKKQRKKLKMKKDPAAGTK